MFELSIAVRARSTRHIWLLNWLSPSLPRATQTFLNTAIDTYAIMIYAMVRDYKLPFVLHAVVEIPASINFMLYPSRQLGEYTPQAHAIIRQYAILLLTSVLISLIFATRPTDDLSRAVAGALAIYHIGPTLRCLAQLRQRPAPFRGFVLSEAFLYLIVHILCGTLLFLCYLGR